MTYIATRAINTQTISYGPGAVVDLDRLSANERGDLIRSGGIVSSAFVAALAGQPEFTGGFDAAGAAAAAVAAQAAIDTGTYASYPTVAGESGVLHANYPVGDCRRYGISPDGVTDWTGAQPAKMAAWITSLSATGVVGFAPTGYYATSLLINASNIRIRLEEGAEWGGIIHVEPPTPGTSPDLTGVYLFGTAVTYDRFGTAGLNGVWVDRIHCKSDGSKNVSNPGTAGRGCHIYVYTKNLTIGEIVVDGFPAAGVGNESAVSIDGFGGNPQNVNIGRIYIVDSDLHGVYLTGTGHHIGDIVVDGYGANNGAYAGSGLQDSNDLTQSQELKGVWINRCSAVRIDRITVGQGAGTRSNALYDVMLDESGLGGVASTVDIGEINVTNCLARGVSVSDVRAAATYYSLWRVGAIRVTTPTGRAPIAGHAAVSLHSPAQVEVGSVRLNSLDTFDGVLTDSGTVLNCTNLNAGVFKNRVLYASGQVVIGSLLGSRTGSGTNGPSVEISGAGAADSRIDNLSVPASTSLAVRALLMTAPRPVIGKLTTANYATSGGTVCITTGCSSPVIREFAITGTGSAGTGFLPDRVADILLEHGTISGHALGIDASSGTSARPTAVGVYVSGNTTATNWANGAVQMLGCTGVTL